MQLYRPKKSITTELWSLSDVEELWILIKSFYVAFSEILRFRVYVGVYLNIVVILHFYFSDTFMTERRKKKKSTIKAWFLEFWEVISSQPKHIIPRNKMSTWFLSDLIFPNHPSSSGLDLGSFISVFFQTCKFPWKLLTQTVTNEFDLKSWLIHSLTSLSITWECW